MVNPHIPILGCSLCCLAVVSCAAIEHGRELQQAQQQLGDAMGRHPSWAVDTPLRTLAVPPSGELDLDLVIDLALTNNRALRADIELIGQAKAELVQAGLLSNPLLTVMLRFPEAGGRASLDIGLFKDFADLWLIPLRKRAAQSILQQRLLSFTDNAVALVRELSTAYATLQYSESAIKLQAENLEVLGQAIDFAQARLRTGSTTQLDVNLLEARRLQAELEVLQLRNDRRITQLDILRLIGTPQSPVDWRPTPFPHEPRNESVNEDALIDWGLRRRLDIQAAGWEVDAALADFQQQRRRLIQSFGIGISGERFERRAIPDRNVAADAARASIENGRLTAPEIEPSSARRAERSQEIDLILGPVVQVPLPIFDQNQAQIAKAQYRARELGERYSDLEQRTVQQIRTAIVTLRTAVKRREIYQQSLLPVQESNLRVAETAYQSAQESILTVLLAQQELVQVRLGLAAAIRDELTARASLARELGGRMPRIEELSPATDSTAVLDPSTQPTTQVSAEP